MKKIIVLSLGVVLFIIGIVFAVGFLEKGNSLDIFSIVTTFISLILLSVGVMFFFSDKIKKENDLNRKKLEKWRETSVYINYVSDDIVNELPIGIIVYDDEYEIKWNNKFASEQLLAHYQNNEKISEIIPNILKEENVFAFEYHEHFFHIIHNVFQKAIYLFDITKEELINRTYEQSTLCIGLIHFDNLNTALSKVDIGLESSTKSLYLGSISSWAAKYNTLIRPFTDEKIMFITTREKLYQMIDDNFSILEKIREISNKYDYKVTISGGFACYNVGPEELSNYANNSVELAEKRGGDQVVVNIEGRKVEFFGARTERIVPISTISQRVNANNFTNAIKLADKVFVMGHIDTDPDSFGSMLLVTKIASGLGKKCYMVLNDKRCSSLTTGLINKMKEEKNEHISTIITEKKALQIIDEDSLLIIVDTQNKAIVLGPTLLEHATNVIVVDHHRSDMDAIKGKINLIDTNSSSVIELLTGLLPYIDVNITYTDLEANILYSAIIIDTQNLINKTSSNTFDALKYLIQNGSDPQVVKQWLRRDLEEINKFNGFISEAIRFEEKFLFILSNEILTSVEVSQLCDLGLEVQGIMASFAISKINETEVKVSARSLKSVNVQSILETLNLSGGGHFTAAALVTKEYSVSELFNMIKEEINKEFQEGDKNVKVILIEDIKDKGKADEIIEVKPGYAQFLISGKKAILATKDNVKELEEKQESIKKASEQIYKTMLLAKESIEGKTVVIKMQVGADLKIFGAVTSGKIAEAFNVQHNILLDKKKISIESDINSLGIYQASIALYKDIKANFHIEVLAENV